MAAWWSFFTSLVSCYFFFCLSSIQGYAIPISSVMAARNMGSWVCGGSAKCAMTMTCAHNATWTTNTTLAIPLSDMRLHTLYREYGTMSVLNYITTCIGLCRVIIYSLEWKNIKSWLYFSIKWSLSMERFSGMQSGHFACISLQAFLRYWNLILSMLNGYHFCVLIWGITTKSVQCCKIWRFETRVCQRPLFLFSCKYIP